MLQHQRSADGQVPPPSPRAPCHHADCDRGSNGCRRLAGAASLDHFADWTERLERSAVIAFSPSGDALRCMHTRCPLLDDCDTARQGPVVLQWVVCPRSLSHLSHMRTGSDTFACRCQAVAGNFDGQFTLAPDALRKVTNVELFQSLQCHSVL